MMIPLVVPPLTGLSVLVTRPQAQAAALCEAIVALGGEAIAFPTLVIEAKALNLTPAATTLEPVAAATHQGAPYDLIIFISANAVIQGAASVKLLLQTQPATRVAAVGGATAAALQTLGIKVDWVPAAGASSEALWAQLAATPPQRTLIVRGVGGREWLQTTLQAHGSQVDVWEVYCRVPATPATAVVTALEQRWQASEIDVVTATSVETLQALIHILTAKGRELLAATPLLVVSERVRVAALELGLTGPCLVSPSAEQNALLGTLAQWRARAR